MGQMHQRNEYATDLDKLKKQIEFDSEIIKKRAILGRRRIQLQLENKTPLFRGRNRNIVVPNGLYHQHQSTLEGVFIAPEMTEVYSSLHRPYLEFQECNLVNNLHCQSCEEPVKIYQFSEDDPPQNLDDYFYFESYHEAGCVHGFRLHSYFPLDPPSYNFTTLHIVYNFFLHVSSGTYCFLPLTDFIGYVGYWGAGTNPGYFIADLSYGIYQHGDVLAGDHGMYCVELYPSSGPNVVTRLDLDQSDYGYGSSSVILESRYMTEIKVVYSVSFYNGYPYPNQGPHHFILDTYEIGGSGYLCNRYLKWGKKQGLIAGILPWNRYRG